MELYYPSTVIVCKDKFTGQHDNKCSTNYHGLSDGMELSGACQTLKGPITI